MGQRVGRAADRSEELSRGRSGSEAGVERFIHLASSPADDDQSMAYFFLLPILSARESIYLAAPYFIPDNHLQSALVEKAKSGVDVRLMLPGPHTDNWITRASAQARYQELLEAGAKIYEYQPTFMHAKYGVIDGKWSIIGSPNLNSRSRQLDEENALGYLRRRVRREPQGHVLQGSRAVDAGRPGGVAPQKSAAEVLRDAIEDTGPAVVNHEKRALSAWTVHGLI